MTRRASSYTPHHASREATVTGQNETTVELATLDGELKTFQPPEGKEVISSDGQAQQIDISAVVGFQSHLFTFRENANTPGRTLEQAVGVTIPAGAGWFVVPSLFTGAFTNGDFSRLTERPLGQFFVQLFVRNNNTLVCRVRLTDS